MVSVSVGESEGAAAVDDCLCPGIHCNDTGLGRGALYLGRIGLVEIDRCGALRRIRRDDDESAFPQARRKPPARDTEGRSRWRACGPLALAVEDPESILPLQFRPLS
jgi:hypothetical protein